MMVCAGVLHAQQTITLLFTGTKSDNTYQQLDSVVITNTTRSWAETIVYPDTILNISVGVGINEMNNAISEIKTIPNPFNGQTEVSVSLTQSDQVTMQIFDVTGRLFGDYSSILSQGTHLFQINLTTPQTYFLTITTTQGKQTLKILNAGNGKLNSITSKGMTNNVVKVQLKSTTDHPFQLGDRMRYVGYATYNGQVYESQTIEQTQSVSENFVLSFDIRTIPTVITNTVSNITDTTATCGGRVTVDGGEAVTVRGVCWSTNHNPTIADNHTTDGIGTGAFTSSITGLIVETTYYVRAYATNSVGTAYGNEETFATPVWQCGISTMRDVDNNEYETVQLGTQCWMAENLRTTKYADNTIIDLGNTTDTTVAYRYSPNDNADNVADFGYLYNWKAVMHNSSSSDVNPSGVQGICPTGWHVPSAAEFDQMQAWVGSHTYHCGDDTSAIAKSLAFATGWNTSTITCAVGNGQTSNNTTGFSAPSAGYYYGAYNGFGTDAFFCSATEFDSTGVYYRCLYYNNAYVGSYGTSKYYGFSVRCLRD